MKKYRMFVDFQVPDGDTDLQADALTCAEVAEHTILGYAGDKAELIETGCGVYLLSELPVPKLPKSGWKVGDVLRWHVCGDSLYRLERFVKQGVSSRVEVWDLLNLKTNKAYPMYSVDLSTVECFTPKA